MDSSTKNELSNDLKYNNPTPTPRDVADGDVRPGQRTASGDGGESSSSSSSSVSPSSSADQNDNGDQGDGPGGGKKAAGMC